MEIVKVKDEITQYRTYEWNGNIPLGIIIKAKNNAGEFETKAYQFITNYRGDILSIRDDEDKEVGSYSYDAYGNLLLVDGEVAIENSIRYAGYYYDDETSNYYLQARYYNPENGAFLALDPHLGDDDELLSQNGYIYANNNPLINVNPNGQRSRIIYALVVGIGYVVDAIVTTLTDYAFIVATVFDAIRGYTGMKKAKKATRSEQAKRIVENDEKL